MLYPFTNQVLAQIKLVEVLEGTTAYKNGVYLLSKQVDERVTSSVQLGSYLSCCDFDVPCDSRQGSTAYCQCEEASYPSCSVQPPVCMLTPCERHKTCKQDRQVTSRS